MHKVLGDLCLISPIEISPSLHSPAVAMARIISSETIESSRSRILISVIFIGYPTLTSSQLSNTPFNRSANASALPWDFYNYIT